MNISLKHINVLKMNTESEYVKNWMMEQTTFWIQYTVMLDQWENMCSKRLNFKLNYNLNFYNLWYLIQDV